MEGKWMKVFVTVVAVFTKLWESAAIANNGQRNFRHIPASSASNQLFEWELGLREAVTQVLQRHHYTPDLRLRVLSAPMMHRQKAATPFGDIATLAKGRLYATAGGGFEFVQEDEDRDCGPCLRCNRVMCEDIYSEDLTHLLALWTVKRLRHRTHRGGFNYETEYTVSPIDDVTEAIRDGRFDYSLPGHVFVIKQKEAIGSTYPETYNSKIPVDLFKPDVVVGIDNYGNRHILKTYHPFFTSPTQQQPVTTPPDNQEIELYKILLKTLASKTSTTPSEEGPFRVSLNHYIPPPLLPSPTRHGVDTKPPKQADNVGDVTQPVKTTVHYFMPVGAVLMTTKDIGGSTPTLIAVTEKPKATKKPSMLTAKTKTTAVTTSKKPIGHISPEESEEESEELFPEPAQSGSSTTKNITKPTTSTQKISSTANTLTTKFVIQTESEEGSYDELFSEPVEGTNPTVASTKKLTTEAATKQTTKRQETTTSRGTTKKVAPPTSKFVIQNESEDEELFLEPAEATKPTEALTKKTTTEATTKETTKRHKTTTTRGSTKQVTPPSKTSFSSTRLTSSTSLRTTAAMTPRTTPAMTSISSSTAGVAPSKSTAFTRPTFPKTTKKYRKRPNYMSTITRVQKPIVNISTTISTTSQHSTMGMQTSSKPTIASTTEVKTLSSTAVLPEPSTESTITQTLASPTPTTTQTIPVTLSTSISSLATTTKSYPTQPGPIKNTLLPPTVKLPQSEMLPEMQSTLPMTATTQKVDFTVPDQMQIPMEVDTTSPYLTTTQPSVETEPDRDRETQTIVTTTRNYDKSTIRINEGAFQSEIAPESTKIGTTTQMTERAVGTIPSTTETIYTQKTSPIETTTAFNSSTSSTESETTIGTLKEMMTTIKTAEMATERMTTEPSELLTRDTTHTEAPTRLTVTRLSSATETVETTTLEKVTVTPIYVEMTTPSTVSTETSTPTPISVKHTTEDTFLIDRKPTKPDSKRPPGDLNEDDIFGIASPTVVPSSTTTSKPPMKHLPNEFDDVFDNLQAPHNAKIIFSDFYEASTSPAYIQNTTELNQPMTSQSYETSISFKINKRDRPQFQPSTTLTDPQNSESFLNQQALQLVNHARSIEYLNQDGTDKTVRSPKYKRRRGYVSRTKKLVSKRRRISRDKYNSSQGV